MGDVEAKKKHVRELALRGEWTMASAIKMREEFHQIERTYGKKMLQKATAYAKKSSRTQLKSPCDRDLLVQRQIEQKRLLALDKLQKKQAEATRRIQQPHAIPDQPTNRVRTSPSPPPQSYPVNNIPQVKPYAISDFNRLLADSIFDDEFCDLVHSLLS
ncbi:hypothetical protein H257_03881 [Aphanomyces astaci]|uniref:Uncharacterized protein n=1 Tax=Aphanomyces astaci TaxID=112090 RepID=W4H0U4_APHAT|nr:hypothetical protein H257_03881 [Aphanomyces astaci]ETV84788.1 hypothetical protein H257_03881 [Aphanomyces astaci]|eukprot:XP_009826480.1 hypothetical protein H257_03881 [Aphanomyces astaci]